MEGLISKLSRRNIDVDVVGNQLKLNIPENIEEADVQQVIEEVRKNKEELISFIIKAKGIEGFKIIENCPEKEFYVLSSAQKRLYFLYEFDKLSVAYNMPRVLRLPGISDKVRISDAFNQMIDRHESFRTSFILIDGEPVQKITDQVKLELEYFPSSGGETENIIKEFIRPFDLSHAPLIRAGIIEMVRPDGGNPEHILMVDMHHIIADGVSGDILIRELNAFYNNEKLADLRIQYKDYAEWQQGKQQQPDMAIQKEFWLHEFKDEVPPLQLPVDFARPSVISYEGGHLAFDIGVAETRSLKCIAGSEEMTMFMLILSIYAILISRLGDQEDIVIGTPTAGRQHVDLENMIGLFVNTLALRNFVKESLSFRDFLQDLKNRTLACFDHEHYPFEELVKELKLNRDTGRNQLFDVFYMHQHVKDFKDILSQSLSSGHIVSKFDLTLMVAEADENIYLRFEYSTALFAAETIQRFVGYFKKIMSSIIGNSCIPISDIQIMDEGELDKLLIEFNDTRFDNFKADEILEYFRHEIAASAGFTVPDVGIEEVMEKFTDSELATRAISPNEYYKRLNRDVIPYAINTGSPLFIGHMTSALPGYLHDISKLISQLNQNLVKIETSKSVTFLERQVVAQIHRLFYSFPVDFYNENIQKLNSNLGIITSGGSTANISALLTARNKALFELMNDKNYIDEVSIYSLLQEKGYRDMVIIGTELMHYSFRKAVSVMGLGTKNIVFVKNDEKGSMCIEDLEEKIDTCRREKWLILAVVGVAGSTERGSIDPLQRISRVTTKNNIHFHVDAAWGGALVFSDTHRYLIEGIRNADSITFCGHKQLFLPQGISICLFKDPLQLNHNSITANYQAKANSFDMGRFTIEGSRPALAICLHASLNIIGKKGYELLIDSNIEKANLFLSMIKDIDGFELIGCQINIINYRYIPVEFREDRRAGRLTDEANRRISGINNKIQECQFHNGKTFVSKTIITHFRYGKIVVLRAILSNPLTTHTDLIDVLQDQLSIIEKVYEEPNDWLFSANKKQVARLEKKSLLDLFAAQVSRTPDAIAIVFEGESLTYRQLDERSDQLARYLQMLGVKKEELVVISVKRSLDCVTGILGILKAGAAYVPIDPDYPGDRIGYILEDTGSEICIAGNDIKEKCSSITDRVRFICLEKDWPLIGSVSCEGGGEEGPGTGSSPAYVIYTSGSTGKPKGVVIEHNALTDHIHGVMESADLRSCRSFALFASLAADAGHAILFSSLISGGVLHILSTGLLLDAGGVGAYLKNNSIDCIKIVPSLWLSCIDETGIPLPGKVLIFGGEAFSGKILEILANSEYSGAIYNHYGPTETTIGKCIFKVDRQKTYSNVPIGSPFSATEVYILDNKKRMAPIGIPGELHITGDGLARGYLNCPGLTAEKFIANPFSEKWGGRMYRTGDLCRWRSDGKIEYLGRSDDQIKIRGHRVELGEIEHTLYQYEGIDQAIVIVKEEEGNKCVVAYYVSGRKLETAELKGFLAEKLPGYMVPAFLVPLESMPLTVNGKIDKKALPQPESMARTAGSYEAPRNPTEQQLAMIWKEVLGVEQVGINDNFFGLGGHSLSAMKVVAIMKKEMNVEIPVRILFQFSTIISTAPLIDIIKSGNAELPGDYEELQL